VLWNFLLQTHLQIGLEEDLVDDYISLGNLYLDKGSLKDALQQYRKVIDSDPRNIDVRRQYIDIYLQIGLENDLVDDYLELADVLLETGNVEESIRLYSHVMSLDPDNKQAMHKLTETRSRIRSDIDLSEPDQQKKKSGSKKAKKQEKKESEPSATQLSYEEAIENYKNILSVNPSNANIRCKIAEIYFQTERVEEAMEEWDKASETFIFKGELDKGINLCERILEINQADAKIRDRLSRAILQKDSFKAIESAISAYTDTYYEKNGSDSDDV